MVGAVTVSGPAPSRAPVREVVIVEDVAPIITLPNASVDGVAVTDGGGVHVNMEPLAGCELALLHVVEQVVDAVLGRT